MYVLLVVVQTDMEYFDHMLERKRKRERDRGTEGEEGGGREKGREG